MESSSDAGGAERRGRRSWPWAASVAAAFLAVTVIAGFVSTRLSARPTGGDRQQAAQALPKPVPQPITRTAPGAQVAWIDITAQGGNSELIGIDAHGRQVARLDQGTAPAPVGLYGFWRSPDGASIFAAGANTISSYSALDGKPGQIYPRLPGNVVGNAISPDGRWMALLSFSGSLQLQVIDLQQGGSQTLPIAHDMGAQLPGIVGPSNNTVWGMPIFAPDSVHLYTVTDWGGPVRLTAFSLASAHLEQTGFEVDGQDRRHFPSCAGPAMAMKVIEGGATLIAFCHFDGAVWFFDLRTLTSTVTLQSGQKNPFWLSPIFTPDGHLLYLHQWYGFGDTMQVVDLVRRRMLGPVVMPTSSQQTGPFARLVGDAYAGGIATTVPVSPDGLKLYSATDQGIMVLRIPDLKPLVTLAAGTRSNEVWVSGDGKTLYLSADDSSRLLVMRDDGTGLRSISLPRGAGGFIAAEHG